MIIVVLVLVSLAVTEHDIRHLSFIEGINNTHECVLFNHIIRINKPDIVTCCGFDTVVSSLGDSAVLLCYYFDRRKFFGKFIKQFRIIIR